ncbi:MAG: hypothetical protein ACPG4N_05685, partial [Gammaproteobacteria bacterium]
DSEKGKRSLEVCKEDQVNGLNSGFERTASMKPAQPSVRAIKKHHEKWLWRWWGFSMGGALVYTETLLFLNYWFPKSIDNWLAATNFVPRLFSDWMPIIDRSVNILIITGRSAEVSLVTNLLSFPFVIAVLFYLSGLYHFLSHLKKSGLVSLRKNLVYQHQQILCILFCLLAVLVLGLMVYVGFSYSTASRKWDFGAIHLGFLSFSHLIVLWAATMVLFSVFFVKKNKAED